MSTHKWKPGDIGEWSDNWFIVGSHDTWTWLLGNRGSATWEFSRFSTSTKSFSELFENRNCTFLFNIKDIHTRYHDGIGSTKSS